jgi:hypothetical protein
MVSIVQGWEVLVSFFATLPTQYEAQQALPIEWAAQFPADVPDYTQLPKEWTDALAAADAAGKIPNIPHASAPGGQSNPVYPPGVNPSSPEICSATYKCVIPEDEDLWNAPTGVYGSSFDDGPYPVSLSGSCAPPLLTFSSISELPSPHRVFAVERRNDYPFHDRQAYPHQPHRVPASIQCRT